MITTRGCRQLLQPLQVAGDSDSEGAASSSDPPLRVLATAKVSGHVGVERGSGGADGCNTSLHPGNTNDGDQCDVAVTTGRTQPLLVSGESSDSDLDEYHCTLSVATAADNADQPRQLATASDDECSLAVGDEGTSSGPPLSKRARCSTPPSNRAAKSKQDVQSLFFATSCSAGG